jgi:signal transduction histidine kinase
MRTLRGRFVLSHILPFLVIFPLAGLILLYLIEAQVMLVHLSDDLQERATLIAAAVAQQPETLTNGPAAEEFLAEIGPLVEGEIYLMQADGRVIAAKLAANATSDPPAVEADRGAVYVSVDNGLLAQEGEALAPVIDVNEQIIGLVGVHESLGGLASSFNRLRGLVLLTIMGGMVLGAMVGYALARRLERPIGRTAAAVAGIATGDQTKPIYPEGPAEVQRLAAAVNSLTARLQALEEMRRRSFANIVHELGRPLGAVLAAVQVLRGDAGGDPAVRAELLAGVHKELTAMEPLLDDLSQLHADATGRRRLDRRTVDVAAWLTGILPPWREAAAARGLGWAAEIPPDLPPADIDAPRMAQVVGNLLSNAIKYTAGGGVAVSATAGDGAIRIAVADTGPGIPAAEQAQVFEPFYRGAAARTTEGLGVGLAIARSLTEAHGGRLTLDSAPGRGSVFTIELPITSPHLGNDE